MPGKSSSAPAEEALVSLHGNLAAIANRFDEQKQVLLSVSGDTEQEFIAFGREAGALFSETRGILELVNGILAQVTGDNAFQAVELFEGLIGDAGQLIAADEDEIQSLIKEMSGLRQEMGRLVNHRMKMDRVVRLPLLLLKVGFRIEGSLANERMAKVLESVAMDITMLRDKLTRSTDEQFSGLELAARSMEALVTTLSKMSEEARHQHGEAGARMEELRRHAAQLRQAHNSQGEIARRIGETGRKLHQEFNRVVMALQYHDITRQQLEHVGQAFDSMREWLPSGPSQDDSQIGLLHHASALQIGQTRSTLESLRAAGREFQQGVGTIAQHAQDLTADVSAFSSLCQNEPVFKALDGLLALETFISDRSEIKREVGEAACEIYGKVTNCTEQIRELTYDLRLLAINAQVQAANAGQQAVIEVLAENICRVSDTIQEATQDLAREMDTIMEQITALSTRAWRLGTQLTTEGKAVADGVPRCVSLLRELQTSVEGGLQTANHKQQELQEKIGQLLQSVHFPELASQRLETVLGFFEEIQRETLPAADGVDASHEAIVDLSSSYTMASEREVHAATLGAEPAKDGAGDIELFGVEEAKADAGGDIELFDPEPAKEDAGDGVELFGVELFDDGPEPAPGEGNEPQSASVATLCAAGQKTQTLQQPEASNQESKTAASEQEFGDNVELF